MMHEQGFQNLEKLEKFNQTRINKIKILNGLKIGGEYIIRKNYTRRKYNKFQSSEHLVIKMQDPSYYHYPKSKLKIDQKSVKFLNELAEDKPSQDYIDDFELFINAISKNKNLAGSLSSRYSDICDLYVGLMGSDSNRIRTKIGITTRSIKGNLGYSLYEENSIQDIFCPLSDDQKYLYAREFEQNHQSLIRIGYGPRILIMFIEKFLFLHLKKEFGTNMIWDNRTKLDIIFQNKNLDIEMQRNKLNEIYSNIKIVNYEDITQRLQKRLEKIYFNYSKLNESFRLELQKYFDISNLLDINKFNFFQNSKPVIFERIDSDIISSCKLLSPENINILSNIPEGYEGEFIYLGKLRKNSSIGVFYKSDMLDDGSYQNEIVLVDILKHGSLEFSKI